MSLLSNGVLRLLVFCFISSFLWLNEIRALTGLDIAPNGIGLLVDHLGRCTGEAYVQFTSAENLDRAKEKHMEKIGHRWILRGLDGWFVFCLMINVHFI